MVDGASFALLLPPPEGFVSFDSFYNGHITRKIIDHINKKIHIVVMTTKSHEQMIAEWNKDPAFKAEYDALGNIFPLAGANQEDSNMSRLATNTKHSRRITPKKHDKTSCFCHSLDLNQETAKALTDAKEGRTEYIQAKDTEDLFDQLGI